MFGYEAGAFTGATHAKPGKFELCNKGTILLDEIGEMPPLLQAKLLHVLQDQQFSRLGSRSVIKVDVRILAATNINIPEALANKRLREDLYYRLNAFTMQLPPLRERKEEIPILLKHFMSRMSEQYARPPLPLSPNMLQACQDYSWPGNLRELNNFIKRYLVLGDEKLAIQELQPRDDGHGVRPEAAHTSRRARWRTEICRTQRQGRSRSGSHPAGPRPDQLEPQAGRGTASDQLQSSALQDPPVRHRADEEPQTDCGRLGWTRIAPTSSQTGKSAIRCRKVNAGEEPRPDAAGERHKNRGSVKCGP